MKISENSSRVQVSVVGCGFIAQNVHIPVWKKMDDVDLVSVIDINPDLSKRVAKKFGVASEETLDALIESDVDIIDVCTPTSTYFNIILKTLQSGKHVITEKPMVNSSDKAKVLIKESKERGKRLGVVHHFLYSRGFLQIRDKIKLGDLGELLHFEITYPLNKPNPLDHWVSKEEEGGPLFEHGIHPCYLAVGLIGEPDTVQAAGTYNMHSKLSNIVITLEKGDITGCVHISPAKSRGYSAVIRGTKKEIFWDVLSDTLKSFRDMPFIRHPLVRPGFEFPYNRVSVGASVVKNVLVKGFRYTIHRTKELDQYRLFKAFVNHVKDRNAPFHSTATVGYEVIKVLEKARESLRSQHAT